MDSWKQYLFSIIVCSITCGIVSQIAAVGKRKELLRLICGVILTITILSPLSRLDLGELLYIPQEAWDTADYYIAKGEDVAFQEQAQCIKAAFEAYILDKAKSLGAEVSAEISLDETLVPVFAEITGGSDQGLQKELENILTTDLGIPKENQKWIWNQESSSS